MRVLRLTVVATSALLIGAACGSATSPEGGSALQLIAASADKTTDAGSAQVSMEMDMTGPQGAISMTADGAFDFAEQLGHMTMHMDLPEGAGTGGPMDMEMVLDGLTMYMKYPTFMQVSPSSKPWVRIDLDAMSQQAGVDMAALMQGGNQDPSQALEYLRGVSDIATVGEEDIRGAPATHYRGTIDFDKVVENAPADVRERVEATIKTITDAVGEMTIPVEVWIDAEGRVVRMSQSFDFQEGAQAGTSMSMVMDFFDFGTPVDIEIPPPSQTTDITELMGQMGAGASP